MLLCRFLRAAPSARRASSSKQPHDRVAPLFSRTAKVRLTFPQSHLQSHFFSSRSITVRRPNRWPVRSVTRMVKKECRR